MPIFYKTKQAQKCKAVDESAEDILHALTSSEPASLSHQRAALARAHNLSFHRFSIMHLLSMPPHGRLMLLKPWIVYTDADDSIHVSTSQPELSRLPELLSVCRQIKDEMLPVWYRENWFVLDVQDYDIRPLMPWIKRADVYRNSDGTRTLPIVGEPCAGRIEVSVDGEPVWENLVEWLRLAHAAEVMALDDENCTDDDQQTRAVKGAFTLVMGYRKYPWQIIEKALRGVREILGAVDVRWVWEPAPKEPSVELGDLSGALDGDIEDGAPGGAEEGELSGTLVGDLEDAGPDGEAVDDEGYETKTMNHDVAIAAQAEADEASQEVYGTAAEQLEDLDDQMSLVDDSKPTEVQALDWASDLDDSGVGHANFAF